MDNFERQMEIDRLQAIVNGLNEDEEIFGLTTHDIARMESYITRIKELQHPQASEAKDE